MKKIFFKKTQPPIDPFGPLADPPESKKGTELSDPLMSSRCPHLLASPRSYSRAQLDLDWPTAGDAWAASRGHHQPVARSSRLSGVCLPEASFWSSAAAWARPGQTFGKLKTTILS